MALTTAPFGAYTDATGVIDATAAAEIVAMVTELKTFFPSVFQGHDAGQNTPVTASEQSARSPGFDAMPLDLAEKLVGEIDALAAAIAAAPTA